MGVCAYKLNVCVTNVVCAYKLNVCVTNVVGNISKQSVIPCPLTLAFMVLQLVLCAIGACRFLVVSCVTGPQ